MAVQRLDEEIDVDLLPSIVGTLDDLPTYHISFPFPPHLCMPRVYSLAQPFRPLLPLAVPQ
jgi:hypothetical protein